MIKVKREVILAVKLARSRYSEHIDDGCMICNLNFHIPFSAQEMFLKISRALEVLTDAAARAAYDHVYAAKSARKIYMQRRTQQESESRRKLREELERREASGLAAQQEELRAQAQLQKEVCSYCDDLN